jgi:hypothetical protein
MGRQLRLDLLDHVIVVNERHLKRLMTEYVRYYHEDRTRLALARGRPFGRKEEKQPGSRRGVVSMWRTDHRGSALRIRCPRTGL